MFEVILSPEAQAFFANADRPLARKLTAVFRGWNANRGSTTTSSALPAILPAFFAIE